MERREKWASYYASNSAALAHYHLALGKSGDGVAEVKSVVSCNCNRVMLCYLGNAHLFLFSSISLVIFTYVHMLYAMC